MLTGAGRGLRLTATHRPQAAAPNPRCSSSTSPSPSHVGTVRDAPRRARGDGVDGALHAIGFAPEACLGGGLPRRRLGRRVGGAGDLGVLAQDAGRAGRAADDRRRVDRRSRLRRHRGLAGLRLDGRGQGGARVDHPLPGPRARARGRSAATSSPPDRSRPWRPSRSPGSRRSRTCGTSGPRSGWDVTDSSAVAKACVALLSDWFPTTTGSMVHVDGGYHAIGA